MAPARDVASVDEAGDLVAESAPRRLAAFIYLAIRAIGRYVAVLPAVKTSHSISGFRVYYSYRQNKHLFI